MVTGQPIAGKDLRAWTFRVLLALLAVLMAVASTVSNAQDGADAAYGEVGSALLESHPDWPEIMPEPDPAQEPEVLPQRAQPPCPECTGSMYEAEVRVRTAADLQQLQQMGLDSAELGTLPLQVSGEQLSAMKHAGLDYVVTSWSFSEP